MKAGIIGLGKMGLLHTGILNSIPDIEIIAIAEKNGIVRKYIIDAIPNVTVYDNYEKMLENENLDFVYITTPSHTHLPAMESCIKNNTNFFVEKPLSKNQNDARQICTTLKETNLITSVGYNGKFISTFSKAKYLLDSKILGNISKVESSMFVSNIFSKPSGWRYKKQLSGGGVLLEFGCHLIDILLWYFGNIENVNGKTSKIYSDVEDEASMSMVFTNGIKGELNTSWSKPGYRMPEINVIISGSNGTMRINQDFIQIDLNESTLEFDKLNFRIYKQELESEIPFDVGGPDYSLEDLYFVDCIKNNKKSFNDVFQASKTQSVIEAMYESDKKNSQQQVQYIE